MFISSAHLRWSFDSAAEVVLAEQVAEQYPGPVLIGRLCPRCGSSEHGRPWARAGSLDIPVSVSRSGGHLLTVVGPSGLPGIGVDVESASPERTWPLAEMLAPGEEVEGPEASARLWATKEAILKSAGVGLGRRMTDFRVADFVGRIEDVAAPAGYVAVLALPG